MNSAQAILPGSGTKYDAVGAVGSYDQHQTLFHEIGSCCYIGLDPATNEPLVLMAGHTMTSPTSLSEVAETVIPHPSQSPNGTRYACFRRRADGTLGQTAEGNNQQEPLTDYQVINIVKSRAFRRLDGSWSGARLGVLASVPVGIVPITPWFGFIDNGTELDLAGWGRLGAVHDTGNYPNDVRIIVEDVRASFPLGHADPTNYAQTSQNAPGPNLGDSGGPVLIEVDGQPRLVGEIEGTFVWQPIRELAFPALFSVWHQLPGLNDMTVYLSQPDSTTGRDAGTQAVDPVTVFNQNSTTVSIGDLLATDEFQRFAVSFDISEILAGSACSDFVLTIVNTLVDNDAVVPCVIRMRNADAAALAENQLTHNNIGSVHATTKSVNVTMTANLEHAFDVNDLVQHAVSQGWQRVLFWISVADETAAEEHTPTFASCENGTASRRPKLSGTWIASAPARTARGFRAMRANRRRQAAAAGPAAARPRHSGYATGLSIR